MKIAAWVLLAGITLGAPAFAEEGANALPAEAQRVLQKSEELKSYRADLVLEAQEEDGKMFRLEGKLLYSKPGRRRLAIKETGAEGEGQTLVNDGKTEWQHHPEAGVVYRLTNLPPTPGPHRPFSEAQPGTVRFIEKRGTRQEPTLRFDAKPLAASVEGSPVAIDKIRIEVGEKDGLVREMALLDASGNPVLTQRFSNIELNVPTSEQDFTFIPPQGVAVVDMPPEEKEAE